MDNSQIANGELGGGQIFFTLFQAVNISGGPASFTVSFFDGAGDPMTLPIVQDGVTINANMIGDAIAPGGVRFARTAPNEAAVQIGYAVVNSVPEGAVAVVAQFSNQVPGERLFQASIPVETRLHQKFFMPFINSGGFVGSIAVVSLVQQTVSFRVLSASGTELCSTTEDFEAGQHKAFLLANLLPCSADTNAVLAAEGESIGLSAVGFTAADMGQGAFVTAPVYGPLP
ncbi:MAG: hypothetical protein O2968_22240 [Acidobacteria bacterium]|nr:hypothetical protein [Acidobacteriota bacterium]